MELTISTIIDASPNELYEAWLNSEEHTKMTGSSANISKEIGSSFTSCDGYIQGKTLKLDPPNRIIQQWRSKDFSPEQPDSEIDIQFKGQGDQTLISITLRDLDKEDEGIKEVWVNRYFTPMKKYFQSGV